MLPLLDRVFPETHFMLGHTVIVASPCEWRKNAAKVNGSPVLKSMMIIIKRGLCVILPMVAAAALAYKSDCRSACSGDYDEVAEDDVNVEYDGICRPLYIVRLLGKAHSTSGLEP